MWRGLALLCALIGGCAASAPSIAFPAVSGTSFRPAPEPPAIPARGPVGTGAPREVTLTVRAGRWAATLRGWCRVGQWTTLERVSAAPFVTRETWGRLGTRRPKLLTRITDELIAGVIARVRPRGDGTVAFRVELTDARVGRAEAVETYHGQEVRLPRPVRSGYLFAGSAPREWFGAIARWGDDVSVHLDAETGEAVPPGALLFRSDGPRGFVAGATPSAEAFEERWLPADPISLEADGVERRDFRLVRSRHALGFRFVGDRIRSFGPSFEFDRHE